jgi:hypothetical protein
LLFAIHVGHNAIRKEEKKVEKIGIWKGIYHAMLICWMNCWKRVLKFECLVMIPSRGPQVNWGNCGILWVNYAVTRVKNEWKDSSVACVIACLNCAVSSDFRKVWRHSVKSYSLTESV